MIESYKRMKALVSKRMSSLNVLEVKLLKDGQATVEKRGEVLDKNIKVQDKLN